MSAQKQAMEHLFGEKAVETVELSREQKARTAARILDLTADIEMLARQLEGNEAAQQILKAAVELHTIVGNLGRKS